ncbi:MAG: cobyrinate a,c-diamide synthase [Candidatus Methanomethylophilaceae archaeon]|jgi:cobyrinic acid a,c-diamide synthase|nr:cobyrinate a,c-diamide synthase [Candidatus Methanomethylophilaceae archaeon]NCA73539.1 cobyrinate a,c-diamide synthase [Gammaproteobacteria bacterium]MDD2936089.1 cobyrinate a,c-diamide synthase [Candidatus Methanomethylophilaceae archaeon]MDD3351681.1 cobyrinate a,c-diamide synthase [Candidatus Methanomethylophilaceae archaeon]MDD3986146.1 cobyrinate a,c-diamide synthase [Candidatus Methanomethylophilaceae archaeon]
MNLPRFMIAAPASGSGKTMLTCGILQALVERGMKVASFKCGPDYIDPMFHSRVIGTRSKNLDAFFCDDDMLKYLFARSAEGMDISVIEGVMGFYDGIAAASTEASSYDLSEKVQAPVVLMIDCKGTSVSCIPVIDGFLKFRRNNIRGVVLNRMSEGIYRELKPVIERETGTEVLGYVPKVSELILESRHLGLVLPDEVEGLRAKLSELAKLLEKTIDIDRIVEIAGSAPDIETKTPEIKKLSRKVKIGVADDDAFCFTYEDNLMLLEQCGAEIVRFSPLKDSKLPDDIRGLVLSGGYPEIHAEALSGNVTMLEDIRSKLEDGMPCMAECGGFMYLHEELEDQGRRFWPMVGYIKGRTFNTGRLTRFGYVKLSPGNGQMLPENTLVKGHEFHYWDSENCGYGWTAEKTSGKKYACINGSDRMMAGFPHIYYYSNPDLPYAFLLACVRYGELSYPGL